MHLHTKDDGLLDMDTMQNEIVGISGQDTELSKNLDKSWKWVATFSNTPHATRQILSYRWFAANLN